MFLLQYTEGYTRAITTYNVFCLREQIIENYIIRQCNIIPELSITRVSFLYVILRVVVSCMNYHGEQMENSATDCCTVRTQTQCLCDMAAWFRYCCITLQIIFLCSTVISIRCKVLSQLKLTHCPIVSVITLILETKIFKLCLILGDTGIGVLEWINMVWKEEFQFPHIKLIFPTADPM